MIYVERLARQLLASPGAYRAKVQLSACRRQVEEAGVWFVDIPRTGSTSIKLLLEQKFGIAFGKSYMRETSRTTPRVIADHTTAREAREILSADLWNRIFTFTIVRNPWDRFYSLFKYRIANREIPNDFPFIEYLWLLERKNTRHPYSPFALPLFFRPMCDFIFDGNDNQLVNYIGRLEEMSQVVAKLQEKLGIDLAATQKAEVLGKPGDYRQMYTPEGVEIVARSYRDDVERFNYEF